MRMLVCALSCAALASAAEIKPPQVLDERLRIELVAAEPDIVTPTGIFVSERGEEEIYADANGKLIYINHSDMEVRTPSAKSIMPDGLVDQLTDQELRDLLAFLRTLK